MVDGMPQGLGGTDVAPRVSVVVPAYNAARYLERALDSALAQTMSDFEVIVVDDASRDTTYALACRIAARDPRIRVLRNERNRGENVSRNRAIGTARGEWIALLDADDAWLPERLERMLTFADDADVISDDVYIVSGSLLTSDELLWSLIERQGLTVAEPYQLSLLDFTHHDLGLLQPVIRRSFLERYGLAYDPTVRYAADFLFFFEILALGARWVQLPQPYYLYYKNAGSVSTNKRVFWQHIIESTRTLFDHPAVAEDTALAKALERRTREAQGHVVFNTLRENLRQRRFAELVNLLYQQPSNFVLTTNFVAKRLYLRALWRVRRFLSGRR